MKRLPRTLAVLGLAAALTAAGLPTASAASWGPIDPVSYAVRDITMSSVKGDCPERTVTMSAKRVPYSGDRYKHALIYVALQDAQDRYVGQEPLAFLDPRFNAKTQRYSMSSSFGICNALSSFGRYTVGHAEIRYGNDAEDLWWGDGNYATATDTTLKYFYVRRAAKVGLTATRSGKRVTLSVAASRFNPVMKTDELGYDYAAKTRYSPYSGQKVRFEVKSGKKWKAVRTVTLSKGKASVKLSSIAKRQFRAVLIKNSTTAGKTSSTVRR